MATICSKCGSQIEDGSIFCTDCGASVEENAVSVSAPESAAEAVDTIETGAAVDAPAYVETAAGPDSNIAGALTGFSNRVYDEEIVAAVEKKRKRTTIIYGVIAGALLIVIPVLGIIIKKEKFLWFLAVGAVAAAITAILGLKKILSTQKAKSFEGKVVDKKVKLKTSKNAKTGEETNKKIYRIIIKKENGFKKRISSPSEDTYNYVELGERIRYHAHLPYPIEKFDKTNRDYIFCSMCSAKNSLADERCCKCKKPLLK